MTRNWLWIIAILAVGCGGKNFNPKPKGYNRIELAPAQYQLLADSFPFQMEYSTQATIPIPLTSPTMGKSLNVLTCD